MEGEQASTEIPAEASNNNKDVHNDNIAEASTEPRPSSAAGSDDIILIQKSKDNDEDVETEDNIDKTSPKPGSTSDKTREVASTSSTKGEHCGTDPKKIKLSFAVFQAAPKPKPKLGETSTDDPITLEDDGNPPANTSGDILEGSYNKSSENINESGAYDQNLTEKSTPRTRILKPPGGNLHSSVSNKRVFLPMMKPAYFCRNELVEDFRNPYKVSNFAEPPPKKLKTEKKDSPKKNVKVNDPLTVGHASTSTNNVDGDQPDTSTDTPSSSKPKSPRKNFKKTKKQDPKLSDLNIPTTKLEVYRLKQALDQCVSIMKKQNDVIVEMRSKLEEIKKAEQTYCKRYRDLYGRLERKLLPKKIEKEPSCLKKLQYLEHKRRGPVREKLRAVIRQHFNYDEENTNMMVRETFPHLFYCLDEQEAAYERGQRFVGKRHDDSGSDSELHDYTDPTLITLHDPDYRYHH